MKNFKDYITEKNIKYEFSKTYDVEDARKTFLDRIKDDKYILPTMNKLQSDYPNTLMVTQGYDEDSKNYVSRGKYFDYKKILMIPCRRSDWYSKCHALSAYYWKENHKTKNIKLCTGYVLSSDALWRQHTWIWETDTNTIYEPTKKRLVYFGYEMNEKESIDFIDMNP